MKFQGIVFDKDGTLLDFNKTWLPIYRYAAMEFADGDEWLAGELLAAHGYDANSGRFASGSLLAAGNNFQIAEAWAQQLDSGQQPEAFGKRLNQVFHELGAREATAVDGLAGTINRLKQSGHKLAVATADSHQGIINSLQSFGVLAQFDFLAGYDSGHGIKPEAGMVLAFCEKMSLETERIVVVGDNRHDMEMGRNAGAGLCVGVLTGTSTRRDLEQIADVVFDDINALPAYLVADHG